MTINVTPLDPVCGAAITGVDLSKPLAPHTVKQIVDAWHEHLVISFPDQQLTDDDLERISQYFGSFGDDPFFHPIAGREHICAVSRLADEKTPLFAENFHSDWSFMAAPPIGTMLYGKVIPPKGGDTLFANQVLAFENLPEDKKQQHRQLKAVHSAVGAYSKEGAYGESDKQAGRSMDIRPSDEAKQTYTHPLIRTHEETGKESIFSTLGYIIGIEGMEQEEGYNFLRELHTHQSKESFVYHHKWQPDMLLLWDNRSLLHAATGNYDGYDRILHRITVYQ